MAVVVTVAKGYDLDYIWKSQGRLTPSALSAGTTSTPPKPGNHPADGGDTERKPWALPMASSLSASRMTRCTSRSTRAPEPS